jgi:hypothetical protein
MEMAVLVGLDEIVPPTTAQSAIAIARTEVRVILISEIGIEGDYGWKRRRKR